LGVERRPAEHMHAERAAQRPALLVALFPGLGARLDEALGDHVHRLLEPQLLPLRAVGAPIFDLVLADRAVDVALGGRALRAQAPAGDRRVRIALDLDDLL